MLRQIWYGNPAQMEILIKSLHSKARKGYSMKNYEKFNRWFTRFRKILPAVAAYKMAILMVG